ncbi:MAG TPA: SDR family oxidoreductase [Candidatus Obscuribacterales bacterium]
MKLKYQNQRILITGASAGLGREMARELAARGAKSLLLVARRQDELMALSEELVAKYPQLVVHACPCDLSDTAAIDRLLHTVSRQVGAVDILINNAGVGNYGLFEDADWPRLERIIRLNVVGLTYLTHKLVNPMIALGHGGILNISSVVGLMPIPGRAVYSASKHYVTAFSEALRSELRGTGVIVSQACPGPVPTEFATVSGSVADMQRKPSFLTIDAAQCAAECLDGLAQGKALLVPGRNMRLAAHALAWVPRPLRRLAFANVRQRILVAQEPGARPQTAAVR